MLVILINWILPTRKRLYTWLYVSSASDNDSLIEYNVLVISIAGTLSRYDNDWILGSGVINLSPGERLLYLTIKKSAKWLVGRHKTKVWIVYATFNI